MSGRTAMDADRTVHEPAPPEDLDSPLSFSMEGFEGQPPSPLITRFWAPGWNSVQSVNKFQAEVGGSLRNGDPGSRLVEPSKEGAVAYFGEIPDPFAPRGNMFLLAPMHHVFGAEELSVLTPGIRDRSPEPYVALSDGDMSRLGLKEGEPAIVIVDGRAYRLRTKLSAGLVPRVAGIPSGVPGSPVLGLPTWARVEKALP